MLRKKDLAKQFELVVKQEIIEHNKAIESSNLTINKIRNDLKDLNSTLSKDIIKIFVRVTELSKDQREVNDSLDKIKFFFTNLSNNQGILNERNHKEIEVIDQSVETVHRNQQKSDKRIASLEKTISSLKIVLKEILKDNEIEKERMSNKIIREVKNLKKEMLNMPSKADEVRIELTEELSRYKVDTVGLMREITILKKDCFIKEKQIENLYTLIERINKKLK